MLITKFVPNSTSSKIEQKGMNFDYDFSYSFDPLESAFPLSFYAKLAPNQIQMK